MGYQTINPYTEELVKSFSEHTDAQLEAIIAQSEKTYENDWSLRSLAERKKDRQEGSLRSYVNDSTSLPGPSRWRWESCSGGTGRGQTERRYPGLLCRQRGKLSRAQETESSRKARHLSRTLRSAFCSALSRGISLTTNWRGSRART